MRGTVSGGRVARTRRQPVGLVRYTAVRAGRGPGAFSPWAGAARALLRVRGADGREVGSTPRSSSCCRTRLPWPSRSLIVPPRPPVHISHRRALPSPVSIRGDHRPRLAGRVFGRRIGAPPGRSAGSDRHPRFGRSCGDTGAGPGAPVRPPEHETPLSSLTDLVVVALCESYMDVRRRS